MTVLELRVFSRRRRSGMGLLLSDEDDDNDDGNNNNNIKNNDLGLSPAAILHGGDATTQPRLDGGVRSQRLCLISDEDEDEEDAAVSAGHLPGLAEEGAAGNGVRGGGLG